MGGSKQKSGSGAKSRHASTPHSTNDKRLTAALQGHSPLGLSDAAHSTVDKKLKIRVARWRIGQRLRQGGFISLPISKYFAFLQLLALAKKSRAHEQMLSTGLTHFAIMPEEAAPILFTHLLSFVEGARRFDGLEDLFFSHMVNLQAAGHRALYAAGAGAWRQFAPSRNAHVQRDAYLHVYDREHAVLTVMRSVYARELYVALATDLFRTTPLIDFIRGLGNLAQSPTTGPVNFPFGAADDRDHCKDRTSFIVQAAFLGAAITAGAIANAKTDKDPLAIWGLALGVGAGGGAAFAPLVSTYACKDDTAGVSGGEPPPPEVSGTIDSLLNDSPDPYFDVTPQDLADELPAPSLDSTGKPDCVDQETWDLVNWATSPDDSSGAGTVAPGETGSTPTGGTEGETGTPTPPQPEGIPNPESDASGGPPFGIGPIGPWAASFDPEAGSGGSEGSRRPKGGPAAFPNPEGGGASGPLALPNGSVFVQAPSIIGSGSINTTGMIRSVLIDGADQRTASCLIRGLPRISANGVSAFSGR